MLSVIPVELRNLLWWPLKIEQPHLKNNFSNQNRLLRLSGGLGS